MYYGFLFIKQISIVCFIIHIFYIYSIPYIILPIPSYIIVLILHVYVNIYHITSLQINDLQCWLLKWVWLIFIPEKWKKNDTKVALCRGLFDFLFNQLFLLLSGFYEISICIEFFQLLTFSSFSRTVAWTHLTSFSCSLLCRTGNLDISLSGLLDLWNTLILQLVSWLELFRQLLEGTVISGNSFYERKGRRRREVFADI